MGGSTPTVQQQPSVQKTETMTPEQKVLASEVAKFYTGKIGDAAPSYTGETVAPLTSQEQQASGMIENLAGSQPYLQGDITSAYQQALAGQPTSTINPETTQAYFQNTIYNPSRQLFQEESMPLIQEAYNGPGGYWGGARADAQYKAERDFQTGMGAQYSNLMYQDEQANRALKESAATRALQAAQGAQGYGESQFNQQLQAASALGQMGQLERTLQQAQLDWNVQEWMRTQPEYSPYLAGAMGYIQTPLVAVGMSNGLYS
jgi:hypothetical protein